MLSISKVLARVIVVEFYKQNSGLFLFIFFVMFGMVEGSQLIYYHLSLMIGMIQSAAFLLIVLFLWLLYAIKSMQFVTSQLARPQYSFLFALTSVSRQKQIGLFFIIHTLVHLPVLLYAIATTAIAFRQNHGGLGLGLILYNSLLCTLLSILSVYKLNHPLSYTRVSLFKTPNFIKQSLVRFYVAFLLIDLKLMLLITKLFSYFTLYGFVQIQVDHYENRVALMGLLVGVTAHAMLIFELRKWEDSYLFFLKNLPLTSINRYLTMAVIFILLLIPEIFLLVSHQVHLIDIIIGTVFSIGYLLLLFSLVHHVKNDIEKYLQYLLIIFLVSFAFILFKLSILVTATYLFYSFIWYKRYFYTYESLRL